MEAIIVFTKNNFFCESFLSPSGCVDLSKSHKKAFVIDNIIQLRVLASVINRATFIIDDFSDDTTYMACEVIHLRRRGRDSNYIVLTGDKNAYTYIGLNKPVISKGFNRWQLIYLLNINNSKSVYYNGDADKNGSIRELIIKELSKTLTPKDFFLLNSMKVGNYLTPNSDSKIKAIKRLYQVRCQIGLKNQIELNMLFSMM